jgi:G6PDH family F420-dependent oxidoreductase
VTQPEGGTVTLTDGAVRYLPNGVFVGLDSFTYQVCTPTVPALCDASTVEIYVIPRGSLSAAIAAELGDGLFATEPKKSIVEAYRAAGGDGPRYAEVPLAWAPDVQTAAEAAVEMSRWAISGWKVISELPNPVNFAAATTTVTPDDVTKQFACGPDVQRHLEVVTQFVDAGFDHLVLQNAGPDPKGFIDFFQRELSEPLGQMSTVGSRSAR